MPRVTTALLLVTIAGSFLPWRLNPVLPGLFIAAWGLVIWQARQDWRAGTRRPGALALGVLALVFVSGLSFAVNRDASWINFGLFLVFTIGPWSLPIFLAPRWTDRERVLTLRALAVVVVIQVACCVPVYLARGTQDEMVGSTFSAHNLGMLAFASVSIHATARTGWRWLAILTWAALFPAVGFRTLGVVLVIGAMLVLVLFLAALVARRPVRAGAILFPALVLLFTSTILYWERPGGKHGGGVDIVTRAKQSLISGTTTEDSWWSPPDSESEGRTMIRSTEDAGGDSGPMDLPTLSMFGLTIADTSALGVEELNVVREQRLIINESVKLAQFYELATTLPGRAPHALVLGLGPGNVNSRAANFRSRRWRGLGETPMLGGFINPHIDYYVVRWENDWVVHAKVTSASSTLEEPFGTWQALYAELGLAGIGIFLFLLGTTIAMVRPMSGAWGAKESAGVLLVITYVGLGFWIDLFSYPDLAAMFWVSWCCLRGPRPRASA